jgi:hypothetical protein
LAFGQHKQIESKLQKRNWGYSYSFPRTYQRFRDYNFYAPLSPYYFPSYDPYFYSPINPWSSHRVIIPEYHYPNDGVSELRSATPDVESFFALGINLPYRVSTNDFGVGMFMAGGKENFFIFSFDIIGTNQYPHYSNISRYEATSWGDVYLGKESETYSYSIGGGRKFKNLYPYATISIFSTDNYLVYRDDTYILSSSGKYTIDGISDTQLGATLGFLVRAQNLSINFSGSTNSVLCSGIGFIF